MGNYCVDLSEATFNLGVPINTSALAEFGTYDQVTRELLMEVYVEAYPTPDVEEGVDVLHTKLQCRVNSSGRCTISKYRTLDEAREGAERVQEFMDQHGYQTNRPKLTEISFNCSIATNLTDLEAIVSSDQTFVLEGNKVHATLGGGVLMVIDREGLVTLSSRTAGDVFNSFADIALLPGVIKTMP